MDWFTLLVGTALFLLFLWTQLKPKNFPPGPVSFPLIGSIPALSLVNAPTSQDALMLLAQQHGPVMGLFLGTTTAVVISGYEAIKHVLSREDLAFRPDFVPVINAHYGKRMGVMFTDGAEWREQRRFTLRNLRDFGFGRRSMESLIQEEARALLKAIEDKIVTPNPKGYDVLPFFPVLVINVLWNIMAGRRFDVDDHQFKCLSQAVLRFFRDGNVLNPVTTSPFLQKIPIINASWKRQVEEMRVIRAFVENTIDEHFDTYDERHMRDFMDVYIREMKAQPKSSFTRDQLTAICSDLFNAGTETTSSTIAYSLRYLIKYPEIQQQMRDELRRVIGTEKLPGMEDVPRLHYTQAVISEVLRHSGLVPSTVPHSVTQDTEVLGYRVPKNSFLLINLWSLHMDPKVWGDPENFRPDRFINQDGTFRKDEHLMAFGIGPRMCLGEPLARYSTFLFLTALVQRFQFEVPSEGPAPNSTQLPGFTTSPAPFRMAISLAN